MLRHRDFLTIEDFFDLVDISPGAFYQAMLKLIKEEYIIKDTLSRGKHIYKWSNIYRYPFPKYKPTDKDIFKVNIKEWETKKYPVENATENTDSELIPEEKVTDKVVTNNVDKTLELINSQIAMLENQIITLKQIKETLVKETVSEN